MRFASRLAIACAFLASAFPITAPKAAPPAWTNLHAPSAGRVTAVAGAGGALLAGTTLGFIYRSMDGGSTWSKTGAPQAYPVLSFFAEGDDVYAVRSQVYSPLNDCFNHCGSYGYPKDIAISHDAGATWTTQAAAGAAAIARGPNGSLWAFTKDSIMRLPAGQSEWKRQTYRYADAAGNETRWAVCRAAVAVGPWLFAIINDRLYYADADFNTDYLTWNRLSDANAYGLAADSSGVVALLATGMQWIPHPKRSPVPRSAKLSWLGAGAKGLLGISPDGKSLMRSLDHGETWTAAGKTFPDTLRSAAEQGRSLAAIGRAEYGLFAADSGADWKASGAGIAETPVTPMLVSGGKVVAGTYAGAFETSVAGGNWSAFKGPAEGALSWMAMAQGTLWGIGNGLWRGPTIDRPAWHRFISAPVYNLAHSGNRIVAAFDVSGGDHVLVICDGPARCRETKPGLLGRSQFNSFYSITSNRINYLEVDGDAIWAADEKIHRSLDGGITWDTAGSPGADGFSGLTRFRGRLYSKAYETHPDCSPCLHRSDDMGTTWKRSAVRGLGDKNLYINLMALGGRLYATTYYGVYASVDGETFTNLGFPAGIIPESMRGDETSLAVSGPDGGMWIAGLEAPITGLAGRLAPPPRALRWSRFPDAQGRARLVNGAYAGPAGP